MKSYVLITPARNEEAFIENTIQSVVAQTIPPLKWIIVSDGSTDQTDAIVERYAKKYKFIQLQRSPGDKERNFGSKVRAFTRGYACVQELNFDFVGNLDADISLEPTYYERIFDKFQANERLGIAGGMRFDHCGGRFQKTHSARNSVGGPFQLFRRKCYEAIGGYRPLKLGGIDAVAEIMARMYGWEVESFPEFKAYHYRCTGTAGGNVFKGNFKKGMQHYVIGYHPLFQIASCVFRLLNYPVVVGSLAVLAGYFWAAIKRAEMVVPSEVISYLRSEQLARLKSIFLPGKILHHKSF